MDALIDAMETHDPACLQVFGWYLECLDVPCVDWHRGIDGWIATVHAWDAYAGYYGDICDDIADYLVCMSMLKRLTRVHVKCTYEDSFRDMYDGHRIYRTSQIPGGVLEALARPELVSKLVLEYDS